MLLFSLVHTQFIVTISHKMTESMHETYTFACPFVRSFCPCMLMLSFIGYVAVMLIQMLFKTTLGFLQLNTQTHTTAHKHGGRDREKEWEWTKQQTHNQTEYYIFFLIVNDCFCSQYKNNTRLFLYPVVQTNRNEMIK